MFVIKNCTVYTIIDIINKRYLSGGGGIQIYNEFHILQYHIYYIITCPPNLLSHPATMTPAVN